MRSRGWVLRGWVLRGWVLLGMVAVPAPAPAQAVKEADVVGAWQADFEFAEGQPKEDPTGWLVLWPDGLWEYMGSLMKHLHGGARWRMVGDTLWLGNDYLPYYHTMITPRHREIAARGHRDLGVMDMDLFRTRAPYPVPDSIYWSKAFRDSTTACMDMKPCGTWVYKVSARDQRLYLVRLDNLSRSTETVATKAVLRRDPLESTLDP